MLDRRAATRPATPPCVECGSNTQMTCVVRTEHALYFRCTSCANVAIIHKPRSDRKLSGRDEHPR